MHVDDKLAIARCRTCPHGSFVPVAFCSENPYPTLLPVRAIPLREIATSDEARDDVVPVDTGTVEVDPPAKTRKLFNMMCSCATA